MDAVVEDATELSQFLRTPPVRKEAREAGLHAAERRPSVEEREVQHRREATNPVCVCEVGGFRYSLEEPQTLKVVHVQHAAKSGPQRVVVGADRSVVPTCCTLEIQPAPAVASVQVLKLDAGFVEEFGHRRLLHAAGLGYKPLPGHVQRLLDVVQHDLLSNAIKFDVAAGRQRREPLLDIPMQPAARAAGESAES